MATIGMARIVHRMVSEGLHVNPLTGRECIILTCPICGYQEGVERNPYRVRVLKPGEGMPTPEDAAEFARLCETPEGRLEVSQRLARIPSHVYTEIDGGALHELARSVGAGDEWESHYLDGKSPLTFKFKGGVEATSWLW